MVEWTNFYAIYLCSREFKANIVSLLCFSSVSTVILTHHSPMYYLFLLSFAITVHSRRAIHRCRILCIAYPEKGPRFSPWSFTLPLLGFYSWISTLVPRFLPLVLLSRYETHSDRRLSSSKMRIWRSYVSPCR